MNVHIEVCAHRVVNALCLHSAMAWLRLVGSLKLYLSSENIGLFCRALLQKRPNLLRSLLIVGTPYMHILCAYIRVHIESLCWSKETPPPGGFPIYYVPWGRTGRKRSLHEESPPKIDPFWGWFFRGGFLPRGSWSGNIVNRKLWHRDSICTVCTHIESKDFLIRKHSK